jgi:hypothetical protein
MLGPCCASVWTPPEPRTAANSVMDRPEVEWRISERPKEGATFGLSHTTHTGQLEEPARRQSQGRQPRVIDLDQE